MRVKYRVRIARTAERDIEEIWVLSLPIALKKADRFIQRMEAYIDA